MIDARYRHSDDERHQESLDIDVALLNTSEWVAWSTAAYT